MDYLITITDPRHVAAISKQTAAFNEGQPDALLALGMSKLADDASPLTEAEFLAANLAGTVAGWADRLAPVLVPVGKWLQRWTAEEKKAARLLGTQNAEVQAWLDELDAHEDVNLTHDVVRKGVPAVCAALEKMGVIAAGEGATRASAILAY